MKKVLIFGYAGFVGPYLADEFRKDNYKVVGSDASDCFVGGKDLVFYKANILDFDEIDKIIQTEKPDVIVNLAAISSVGQSWKIPQKTINVNVIGSLNVLEASRKLENKPKILFVGSSEEYEISDKPISEKNKLNATNPYGISKLAQESFAQFYRDQFGLKVYSVRPFNHTGIGQKETFVLPSFCKQVAEIERSGKSGTISVGNINIKRDFSDVRDIVRAYKMILDSDDDKTIYNVGSGVAYSLEELLKTIISFSSQRIEIVVDKEKFRPVDSPLICCDNSLISKNLGWKPIHDIKETLKSMYESFLGK